MIAHSSNSFLHSIELMSFLLYSVDGWEWKACRLGEATCPIPLDLKEVCNTGYSLLCCYFLLDTHTLCGQNPSLVSTALSGHWHEEPGVTMAKQRETTELALTCAVAVVHRQYAGYATGKKWLMKSALQYSWIMPTFCLWRRAEFQ